MMGFADVWNRTLVYFGIAEEDDYWDEDGYSTNEELERTYNDRPNVRRLPRRARGDEYEDWADPESDSSLESASAGEFTGGARLPPAFSAAGSRGSKGSMGGPLGVKRTMNWLISHPGPSAGAPIV